MEEGEDEDAIHRYQNFRTLLDEPAQFVSLAIDPGGGNHGRRYSVVPVLVVPLVFREHTGGGQSGRRSGRGGGRERSKRTLWMTIRRVEQDRQ